MNHIEQVEALVGEAVPGVEHELIIPRDPRGRWTLDLAHDDWAVTVIWFPGTGFGVTAGALGDDHGYGEGPDRRYPDDNAEVIAAEIVSLLLERRRSARPRGVVLRELRTQLGLSQVELADRLGVQQSAVSKLERREDMSVSSLIRVIESMGGELEFWVRFPDAGPVMLSQFPNRGPGHSSSPVTGPR